MDIKFYNVKTRSFVTVPASQVKKVKYETTTKKGKQQVRYAVKAEVDGMKLTKFVSQADWDKIAG